MGPGVGCMNDLTVLQASQALCCHVLEVFGDDDACQRGVVVGYDHRCAGALSSARFARLAAAAFAHRGVRVVLLTAPCRRRNYRLPSFSAAARPASCLQRRITRRARRVQGVLGQRLADCAAARRRHCPLAAPTPATWRLGRRASTPRPPRATQPCARWRPWRAGRAAPTAELRTAYIKRARAELCRFRALNGGGGGAAAAAADRGRGGCAAAARGYTALHGVVPRVRAAFDAFGHPAPVGWPRSSSRSRVPHTPFPNPEEPGALDEAIRVADEAGCDLIIANDPDADRLGVAERRPAVRARVRARARARTGACSRATRSACCSRHGSGSSCASVAASAAWRPPTRRLPPPWPARCHLRCCAPLRGRGLPLRGVSDGLQVDRQHCRPAAAAQGATSSSPTRRA